MKFSLQQTNKMKSSLPKNFKNKDSIESEIKIILNQKYDNDSIKSLENNFIEEMNALKNKIPELKNIEFNFNYKNDSEENKNYSLISSNQTSTNTNKNQMQIKNKCK